MKKHLYKRLSLQQHSLQHMPALLLVFCRHRGQVLAGQMLGAAGAGQGQSRAQKSSRRRQQQLKVDPAEA